jgi:hypothetical protein
MFSRYALLFLIAPLSLSLICITDAGELPPKEPLADAQVEPGLSDFWTKAKVTADLRLRYEYGDQYPLETSHAGTLRARLGILSGKVAGFQAFAEYEGTLAADRNSYRAASVHGPTDKTIIADPESHELNRAWLSWEGGDTFVKGGRQRIILNNARYVGNVGWRQNEQTFDALRLDQKFGDFAFTYGYIWRANRIFGSGDSAEVHDDFTGSSHIAHLTYAAVPNAKLGAFAYFLDLDNPAGSANSNNSYGTYIDGAVPVSDLLKLTYYGEYGIQTEGQNSPLDYTAHYYHLKGGVASDKYSAGAGFESLGSDNGVGYQFPLGTNHAFNGFADKFLTTPDDGLQDLYLYAGAKLPAGFGAKLLYHWFGSEGGSLEYGQEIDLVLTKKLTDELSALGKVAYYSADEYATDTTRFSLELNFKY